MTETLLRRREFLTLAGAAVAGASLGGPRRVAAAQNAGAWPRGIMMFAITPMIDRGNGRSEVDEEGVARNLEHFSEAPGAKTVCVCGGTGEVFELTPDENVRVVRAACGVNGRPRIVAGVRGRTTDEYIRRAAASGEAGADVVLIMANADLKDQGDDVMYAFYTEILDNVDVGCSLYRNDGAPMSLETTVRISEHPRLEILKYGGRDLDFVRDFTRATEGRVPVFPADEMLAPYWHLAGASGITTGLCLLAQEHSQQQWAASEAGDYREAMRYRDLLRPLRLLRGEYGNALLKAGLEMQGLAGGPMRSQTPRVLDAVGRRRLRAELEKLDLLT